MTKIQEIFQVGFPLYIQHHWISDVQQKAAHDIMNCKTPALGLQTEVCPNCGATRVHYKSCRNRNCPNCQAVPKEIWVDSRSAELIDGAYYHVVFTVPAELNPLFYANQSLLYSLLHQATAETLLQLAADKKYLGATPAIIQVLHTWGQAMNYHPHIHAIVSGAGLTKTHRLVGGSKKGFFIPVKVLSRKFRGKFLFFLRQYYDSGKIHFPASCQDLCQPFRWKVFCNQLYSKDWCPFIKQTFNGHGNAIEYLGRYTHKIAISNSRILSISDDSVTFRVKNYKSGLQETLTISCEEFVRRFLMHILPSGFHKIRYYGLLANRVKSANLALIFSLHGSRKFIRKFANSSSVDIVFAVWKIDVTCCPHCGYSLLRNKSSP